MISSLLQEQGMRIADLDAIAVVSGPGSFTGLRIGVGVAQGLAFGANIPVLGISSLAVMAMKAHQRTGDTHLLVCLAAREQEIYSGAYRVMDGDVQLLGSEQVGPADLKCFAHVDGEQDWHGAGDAWHEPGMMPQGRPLRISVNDNADCYPDAATLSEVAKIRLQKGMVSAAEQALPVYLKEQMDYQD